MSYYVQYHNVDQRRLPWANPPFSENWLGIRTRRPNVQHALGGTVFLIAGVGRPRRFFLWETFEIEEISSGSRGEFHAFGTGWQLAPPVELAGGAFEEFKAACANFVGFRSIDGLAYCRKLVKLGEANRPPGDTRKIVKVLRSLDDVVEGDPVERSAVRAALGHYTAVRALSIRQPHAEAIMRGVKRIEYRSGPTNVRERIFVYAAAGRYGADEEAAMMREYRISDVSCDELPRGVLVGTVELYGCDGGKWKLRKPDRAGKLVAPVNQPQPIWFYPF